MSVYGFRDPEKLSLEEIRLAIAARGGFQRLVSGGGNRARARIAPQTGANAERPTEIQASPGSGPTIFVEIRAIDGLASGPMLFGPGSSLDPDSSIMHNITIGPFHQILLPGERLFAASINPAIICQVMVSSVLV